MSSRVFSNGGGGNMKKKVIIKPFCKVCQDAGKEEQVFSSHWVKDEQGKVCCPTLLSQKCRYCDEPGHTTNYCQALKKHKEIEQKMNRLVASDRRAEEARKKTAKKPLANNNKWAALAAAGDDSSDDDDEMLVAPLTPTTDFPPLSTKVTLRPHQKAFGDLGLASFANIAAAASHLPDPIYALQAKAKATKAAAAANSSVAHHHYDESQGQEYQDQDQASIIKIFPAFLKTLKKPEIEMNMMNWADYSDDEEENN